MSLYESETTFDNLHRQYKKHKITEMKTISDTLKGARKDIKKSNPVCPGHELVSQGVRKYMRVEIRCD